MKSFRSYWLARAITCTVLISLLTSMFPREAKALTTGPHQPEYISYEDGASSDLVNLLTGDFSFNLPILSVPVGSEGSFPVPLSYHAGISPDQEASWIGLGWNINVGAITRSINGFPDDANKELQTVSVKDLTGSRGWSASFLGTSMGWDSQVGHYGVLNLGVELGYNDSGVNSVGLAGFTVSDGNASFDAAKFVFTVIEVVMAILTYGASESFLKFGIQLAMDMLSPDYAPSVATSGYWKYSKDTKRKLLHTDYWVWLDKARVEEMYGVLNLDKVQTSTNAKMGNFPQNKLFIDGGEKIVQQFAKPTGQVLNKGAASDINIDLSLNDEYHLNHSPIALAYDNYRVNAPGISGGITPYRLEVGSVSVPREMGMSHMMWSPVSFVDYGVNKVPFRYEGYPANRYYHHLGGTSAIASPGSFGYGVSSSNSTITVDVGKNPNVLRHDMNDLVFNSQRLSPSIAAKQRLVQGNYVNWLTNGEIKTTPNAFLNSNFLDYFTGASRASFRTLFDFGGKGFTGESDQLTTGNIPISNAPNAFYVNQKVDVDVMVYNGPSSADPAYVRTDRYTNLTVSAVSANSITVAEINTYPIDQAVSVHVISKQSNKEDHSIGGLVITSADGVTYHFSLPIYDYAFKSVTSDKNDPQKNSAIGRTAAFANTWLLTGITGPDFIDRGGPNGLGNGSIDDADWGYWIKFNYYKHVYDYKWRLPFDGPRVTPDNINHTYSEGYKEKYYLNTIESRSHVALFIKDTRSDAKDATGTKTSLRLSEIALLTKNNYNQLVAAGLPACSGKVNVGYLSSNFTGSIATLVQSKAQRRVIFGNNDYSLCPGTPNSISGKLTLKTVSILGRNNAKVLPDYVFEYANNPSFDLHRWDGWGMYSSTASQPGTAHKASTVSTDASAWSLTKVISPGGAQLVVNYEPDTYASISGELLTTPRNGGNGRVGSLQFVDPSGQSYKTRYLYVNDAGKTSGVIAQEPEYIRTATYDFHNWIGYPMTPVMYGKVSVLSGKLLTDVDFTTKQTFQFETPHKSLYALNADSRIKDHQLMSTFQSSRIIPAWNDYSTLLKFQISRRLSRIGKLLGTETSDKAGKVVSKQTLSYSESLTNNGATNYQGVFTEGNLLWESIVLPSNRYNKMQRTTWIDYPWILSKVTSLVDGQTSEVAYTNWDLLTGMVLTTVQTDAVGLKVKSVAEPAYTHPSYAEFGSKADNVSNRNMMTQVAANYTYKLNSSGIETGLVGASANVWKNDWQNYRKLNSTNVYVNDQDLDFNGNGTIDAAEAKLKVWRRHQAYVWKGDYSRYKSDGSHAFTYASDKFNFTAPGSNSHWQLAGSTVRYNHNSLVLEQVDVNGIYAAKKFNSMDKLSTAQATNARYEEVAFSGAEDISGLYMGSEVALGAGTRVTTGRHTGTYAVSTSGNAFIFKSNGLSTNKIYKASVWTNSTNARIYYKLNGGAEILSGAPVVQKKVGSWYLLEHNIQTGATFSSLEVGVKTVTGTGLFDDFRFQPLQSGMTSYVYNPDTDLVEYVLNNSNLYTRFEYDSRGVLTKTYAESFTYGEKIISENKSDFRRFHNPQ